MKFKQVFISAFCFISLTVSGQVPGIKGAWYYNEWTLYHTLIFDNNTVYIDNHIDTVFTLNYSVSNDSLTLWNGQLPKPSICKILTLTNDTLILQGILDTKEIRGYSRKRKW